MYSVESKERLFLRRTENNVVEYMKNEGLCARQLNRPTCGQQRLPPISVFLNKLPATDNWVGCPKQPVSKCWRFARSNTKGEFLKKTEISAAAKNHQTGNTSRKRLRDQTGKRQPRCVRKLSFSSAKDSDGLPFKRLKLDEDSTVGSKGDDCNAMNNITQKLPSPPRRTGFWDHIIELRDAWIASKIQKNFAFKYFSN